MLQYIIKSLLFNSTILVFIYFLNLFLTNYFSQIIIFTFWGCFTIWILSDSFIIYSDLKYISNNYNNLKNQHDIVLKDYNAFLKNKHDEIIIIHKVLLEYEEILDNIDKNIMELKNNVLINKSNIIKSSSLNNLNILNRKHISKYLNSYSCTF